MKVRKLTPHELKRSQRKHDRRLYLKFKLRAIVYARRGWNVEASDYAAMAARMAIINPWLERE